MIYYKVKVPHTQAWKPKYSKKALYRWMNVRKEGHYLNITLKAWRKNKNTGRMEEIQEPREVEIFTLKVLAEAIGRKTLTIKEWEIVQKIFPRPTIFLLDKTGKRSNVRYYSKWQILNLHKIWSYKYGARKCLRDTDLFEQMMNEFRVVMDARYVDMAIVDDTGNIDLNWDVNRDRPLPEKKDIIT